MVIAAVLSAMLACGGDDTCDHPDELTYDCAPVPLGTPGTCSGGPSWGGEQADPDLAFPIGCRATYPFCTPAYPNYAQDCDCIDSGGPQWACPI